MVPKRDFEELLLEAVDEALSSLRESLRQEIYDQLQSLNVQRLEIPHKIETFAHVVEEIFGPDALELETLILQKLYNKVGGYFDPNRSKEFSFIENISRVRNGLYEELVNSVQGGLAVFCLEKTQDSSSLRLVAVNKAAAKIAGAAREEILGKRLVDVYPEVLQTDVLKTLVDVVRSGRPRNLGEFHSWSKDRSDRFSIAAFPLSSNCLGLVFKSFAEPGQKENKLQVAEKPVEDVQDSMGEWKWEPDTQWRQVHSGQSHARERWIQKKIIREPHRAEYFSVRGKECLENGDLPDARKFFQQAEENYPESDEGEGAFENASLRIKTYGLEERPNVQEYFQAAEEYFHEYADFSMHEYFLENLGTFCQWKGYGYSEERRFEGARGSYKQAEEIFLMLKKRDKALFNSSRGVLTYRVENSKDFAGSAAAFLEEYKELSESKYYKEIRAHFYAFKADETSDSSKRIEFLSAAEKVFLEIGQRELAFENACKGIDLHWVSLSSGDERSTKKCFEATERFFEVYQDFSEQEEFRKRLAKYYLFQARALASQLQMSLRQTRPR